MPPPLPSRNFYWVVAGVVTVDKEVSCYSIVVSHITLIPFSALLRPAPYIPPLLRLYHCPHHPTQADHGTATGAGPGNYNQGSHCAYTSLRRGRDSLDRGAVPRVEEAVNSQDQDSVRRHGYPGPARGPGPSAE